MDWKWIKLKMWLYYLTYSLFVLGFSVHQLLLDHIGHALIKDIKMVWLLPLACLLESLNDYLLVISGVLPTLRGCLLVTCLFIVMRCLFFKKDWRRVLLHWFACYMDWQLYGILDNAVVVGHAIISPILVIKCLRWNNCLGFMNFSVAHRLLLSRLNLIRSFLYLLLVLDVLQLHLENEVFVYRL